MQGYIVKTLIGTVLTTSCLISSLSATALADTRRISHSTLKLPSHATLFDGRGEATGHALTGTTLRLLVNGKATETVTTGRKTFWRLPVIVKQPGKHEVTIQQLRDNLVTWSSAPISVVAPFPPQIAFPVHEENYRGDFLQIKGRGIPNKTVAILINQQEVGTTITDNHGVWQSTIEVGTAVYDLQAEYPRSLIRPSNTVTITIERATTADSSCDQGGIDLGTHYLRGPCEDFSGIANKLGISKAELLRANADLEFRKRDNGHHNWLRVPPRRSGMTCGTEGYKDGNFYVVGSCDNISYISRRFNYRIKSLAWFNPKLARGDTSLKVGELVRLPSW